MNTQLTLANLSNEEIEKAVPSLTLRHGFKLEDRLTADFDLLGMRVAGEPSMSALSAAASEIREQMAPASEQELLAGLIRLKSLTSSRNMADADLDFQIEAYVDKLREYPRDAALKALSVVANETEWFPAWKTIKDWCDFYSRRRQMALGAIEAKILSTNMKRVAG